MPRSEVGIYVGRHDPFENVRRRSGVRFSACTHDGTRTQETVAVLEKFCLTAHNERRGPIARTRVSHPTIFIALIWSRLLHRPAQPARRGRSAINELPSRVFRVGLRRSFARRFSP